MKINKKNVKDTVWFNVVSVVIAAIIVVGGVCGINEIYNREKQKVIDEPPTENFIEEDLEWQLASLDVVVIDKEQAEDVFVAKVWANGAIHRAEYRVNSYLFAFYWELEEVRIIGLGERP